MGHGFRAEEPKPRGDKCARPLSSIRLLSSLIHLLSFRVRTFGEPFFSTPTTSRTVSCKRSYSERKMPDDLG